MLNMYMYNINIKTLTVTLEIGGLTQHHDKEQCFPYVHTNEQGAVPGFDFLIFLYEYFPVSIFRPKSKW